LKEASRKGNYEKPLFSFLRINIATYHIVLSSKVCVFGTVQGTHSNSKKQVNSATFFNISLYIVKKPTLCLTKKESYSPYPPAENSQFQCKLEGKY
jgi:hypothetical protein